jgi:3-dehydroquinate synthase
MDNILIKSKLYDYEVEFINDLAAIFDYLNNKYNCTFVIDVNIYNIYRNYFEMIDVKNIFFVEAIEDKKNIYTIIELIDFWKSRNIQKNWKVICFGGGITQDIVTFASNIYLRNIDWYFFPTTLLAMCDSCIGGKCGINFREYKNQLGVFYPPKKIYIDIKFLDTLTKADYINGWGELLKFSLTSDKTFYDELISVGKYIPCYKIDYFIHRGLLVKKNIIELDEFEGDLRRILNYGHTFGHALESYTKNRIPHGTAVIWGIDVVNYIAVRENILDKEIYSNIKKIIKKAFVSEEIVINDADAVFNILFTDKKVKNNTVYFAFLNKLSNLIIHPMKIDAYLLNIFKDYLRETHEYYGD